MSNKYKVQNIRLFIPNSVIRSMMETDGVDLHKLIRYSSDYYLSSRFGRKSSTVKFFSKITLKAIKYINKYNKIEKYGYVEETKNSTTESDQKNSRFENQKKNTNSSQKDLVLEDKSDEELKLFIDRYKSNVPKYKIKYFQKILKGFGFKSKKKSTGLDIIEWNLPSGLRYNTRFTLVYYALIMALIQYGDSYALKNCTLKFFNLNEPSINYTDLSFQKFEQCSLLVKNSSNTDEYIKDDETIVNIFQHPNSVYTLMGLLEKCKQPK